MNADIINNYNRLIDKVDNAFERLIARNNQRHNGQPPLSVFDLQTSPSISFNNFAKNLLKLWEVENTSVVYALILIDRFCKESGILLTNKNIFTIFIISLLISAKMNEDIIFSDQDFAKLSKMPLNTLSKLERVFLHKLEYKTFICNEIFCTYNEYFIENTN